ncbi:MAG: glycosyltransferase family 4 protein [Bacteroidales bacterium]|jgi:glycosyltransferase involved in cell wall biosynthesis|nr:glycosyltransferase family 4 protein [Bacteroidales bacterium]
MNKVLILTYYWPPSGGAGVQRWLKFTRYLPSTGWQPVVLTVTPEFAAYPITDDSLAREVPPEVEVIRTKAINYFSFYSKDPSKIPSGGFANNPGKGLKNKISRFIRGNFFIPDPRRGWNSYAVRKASDIIRREDIKYVITTSPPHSTQLIGLRLKKRFPGITWIADLRDTWTDIYYYNLFYPTLISKTIDSCYEKEVLRKADQIITVGNNLAKTYISKTGGISLKMHIIPNGYDENDFAGISSVLPAKFTITYVGTLSEVYPLDGLLSALASLEKEGVDFLLRFAGTIPAEIKAEINSYLSITKTEFISYVPHQEAIKLMVESSMLLLIIPGTRNNDAITPGKVFEYIAAGKPVLYIGPHDGDAAYHLKLCGHTGIFSGKEPEEITKYLTEKMKTQEPLLMPHTEYSRKNLTLQLDKILKSS